MANCEKCGGKKWLAKINSKTGIQETHRDGRRVWKCWRCGNVQEEIYVMVLPVVYRPSASILYLDIESSLSEYYNYGRKVPNKYLSIDNLKQEYFTICWAASYMGKDKIFSACVKPEEAAAGSDKNILAPLHDLMTSADILAGHNANKFDLKKLNTRFILNGFAPITNKKTLDSLTMARKNYDFEGNGLDYLEQRFGMKGKDHITQADWRACMTGDKKTLDKVIKYCIGDVKGGKEIMQILMPYSGKSDGYGAVKL